MTLAGARSATATWTEPPGPRPRATVIVLPGRGEHPGVYERLGTRLAGDAYRVHAVGDASADHAAVLDQVRALLEAEGSEEPGAVGPAPRVLVGSDTGALVAAALVADGAAVDGLVLAGLPTRAAGPEVGWEQELELRTSCPTHRGRLDADGYLRRGALTAAVPDGLLAAARPEDVRVPVLGLHGDADAVSPLDDARAWFAQVPDAELVAIASGVHDALNDQTHRTAAAEVVLFLERVRAGAPIARPVRLR